MIIYRTIDCSNIHVNSVLFKILEVYNYANNNWKDPIHHEFDYNINSDFYINDFNGVYGLNWAQINYVIWMIYEEADRRMGCLESHFANK